MFWRAMEWLILVNVMAVWHIFPVLVLFGTKKNLATLVQEREKSLPLYSLALSREQKSNLKKNEKNDQKSSTAGFNSQGRRILRLR
jgi:hypothetical protein